MPCVCGLMLGGGIETAAAAHFTAAVEWMGKVPHHCLGPLYIYGGFDTDHITEDIVHGQPARIKDGFLYPPHEPGLLEAPMTATDSGANRYFHISSDITGTLLSSNQKTYINNTYCISNGYFKGKTRRGIRTSDDPKILWSGLHLEIARPF